MKTKKCSRCKEEKPLTEFSKRSASKDGLSYTCKSCERETAKRSYERMKGSRTKRPYYQRHREAHLALCKRNYEENREKRLEQSRKYREEHPEVWRKAEARRRKRLKKARVEGEGYCREDIILRDSVMIGGKSIPICQICKKPISNENELQIDHIIPINQGGLDIEENVRVVHKDCNIKRPKDGRDLDELL